jgi:DnaJ-class molecular chaperone
MSYEEQERLKTCGTCEGVGRVWDDLLSDWVINCPDCVGNGVVCRVCLLDSITCPGAGTCYEENIDLDAEWSDIGEL